MKEMDLKSSIYIITKLSLSKAYSSNQVMLYGSRPLYLRIKSLFFNVHDVMKTVGGVKIQ